MGPSRRFRVRIVLISDEVGAEGVLIEAVAEGAKRDAEELRRGFAYGRFPRTGKADKNDVAPRSSRSSR